MKILGKRQSDSGFTLVEMMIVISIIVMLASLTVPVTISILSRARVVQCKSNMSQIYKAIFAYSNDYQMHMPPGLSLLDAGGEEGEEGEGEEVPGEEEPIEDTESDKATNLLWSAGMRVGLGVLHDPDDIGGRGDYISDPKVFYCSTGPDERDTDMLEYWGSSNDIVESSFLYRAASAGASAYVEENIGNVIRVIIMDYNSIDEDEIELFNHGGERVNVLLANGAVLDYENREDEFICNSESEEEHDRVFLNADMRGTPMEAVPTEELEQEESEE